MSGRSTALGQAALVMARGLGLDPCCRERGYADGYAGNPVQDDVTDPLGYRCGYFEGTFDRRMTMGRGGGAA